MTELFGRVTAVPTFRQMFPHIGQEISTPANRDIQETVVETAFTGRREFPVGTHASGTELLAGLVQSGRGTGRVDTQQAGRYRNVFRLDLDMPQQALRGPRKSPECALGEQSPFGGDGPRRAKTTTADRLAEFRKFGGHLVIGGPLLDELPYRRKQLWAQSSVTRPTEHPVESRGSRH
ncbi:hypothetical protein [Streptomyces sp. NBC_00285]|uniref:hypothetical protein n=1 Tax=Streptomyces sp. NBC_00285 TaxID=2975700 RepID=UPI002E2B2756|nr:hypothetical protein [Streptomyces sp. NBC_00285]